MLGWKEILPLSCQSFATNLTQLFMTPQRVKEIGRLSGIK